MVIFLYRWKIKPGKETQFEKNWATVTKAILKECGSYGSRLHVCENGEYVGYAQWPDLEAREKCQLLDPASEESRKLMRDAVLHSYPDEFLKIKSDLLVHPAAQN